MSVKIIQLIIIVSLVGMAACNSAQKPVFMTVTEDSLAAEIQRVLDGKKKAISYKRELESNPYRNSLMKYRPIIKKYAKRYGFDWRLIVAQIMQESQFKEAARSPVGASGLMQLMPGTSREITSELDFQYILKNPRENIAAGIYHLQKQYGYFPNADYSNRLKLSLASYNCGAGRIFDSQSLARHFNRSPLQWINIRHYLTMLKQSDWETHLQVWPQGKPKYGYFYGFEETITYVDRIWEKFMVYREIL